MASKNNPTSSADLIRKYSKARVISSNGGRVAHSRLRPLTSEYVKEAMIRQYK